MQSEIDDKDSDTVSNDDSVEELETDIPEGTVVMSEDTFDDSSISMEVNVESLVREFDDLQKEEVDKKKEVRRKLEELAEERSFEDTYAVDFDD